jgi:hypothetical protein
MRVLFFFSILHRLYCEIAKDIASAMPSASFCGLAYGQEQRRYLRTAGFPSEAVCAFNQYLAQQPRAGAETADLLRRWEVLHGTSLSLLISCDRRYSRMPRDEVLWIAAACISCVDSFLEAQKPNVIITEGIDCLLSYVLYYEARSRGIPVLITYAAPLPRRFAIYGNPENRWEKVNVLFQRQTAQPLTDPQRDRAEAVLRSYHERLLVPTYLHSYRLKPWSPVRLRRDVGTVRALLLQPFLDPLRKLSPSYNGGVSEAVWNRMQRAFRQIACATYFDSSPNLRERFVLLPLQLEPEASTAVLAPFCADQAYVVECVAKSLPVDHMLYVKEHPVMIGRRPISFYRRLSSLPNVRLVDPNAHSQSLVAAAAVIVTVTSTVGWEGVVYEKPVVVLGNVWYDSCGLVTKVRSMKDLRGVLDQAIADFRPNHELLLRFITATLEGTYDGEIDHPHYNPSVTDSSNVRAVARSIFEHLEWCTAERELGQRAMV